MTKLIDDLSVYGVDAKDVLERFVGDEELYRDCLMLFVNDNAFSELGSALECKDYATAFEKAHLLKGVCANLGLAVLLEKICVLVETLRERKTEGLDEMYRAVIDSIEALRTILS